MIGVGQSARIGRKKRPDFAAKCHAFCMDLCVLEDTETNLPRDAETLQALLLESRAQNAALRATVVHHKTLIERLKMQLARLRRMQFGRSSEKLSQEIEQLELLIEDLETPTPAQVKAAAQAPDVQTDTAKARRALPEHLPRETVVHAVSCTCTSCGGELRQVGEDVSEMLEIVPEHWKVIRHVRPKYACAACDTLVQAPAPIRPIAKGIAGPGLIAHVLVGKYADHLPLYRQSEIYARTGIELARSTLSDMVGGSVALLEPLVDRIAQHVLTGSRLHADDTPVPVLSPGLGKTKTGRLWTYVRDDRPWCGEAAPAVLFRYSPDRKGEHPRLHLKDFKGTLQADGYAGFHHLYDGGLIQEAACWAHVRRKFFDIHEANGSPIAFEALQRIAAIYAIERDIKGKPPDIRREHRQSRAGPLIDALKIWLQDALSKLSAKAELANAIRYALSRWPALLRYRDDGTLEIDNNAAERSLRPIALGRKNFLFCGSDAGGERAAAIYSLIGTAKLNEINPEAYLRYVIERIAEHPANQLDALLPWNVAAQFAID